MPRGIHPGHVAAFFAASSGSDILLETVLHAYLVFYWNRAPFLFGILFEIVLHPYLVFYWKPCYIPLWKSLVGTRYADGKGT